MTRDPMTLPMIFLRIGWMNRYRGRIAGDPITGGGAFVTEHRYGHEIFNFQPFEGRVLGYVQPPSTAYNAESGPGVNIGRLGASSQDDSLSGVIAVWIARSPQGGSVIVGWYKNATVYRHWQRPPPEANRRHQGNDLGFYVTAASRDATLLPPDERVFQVPRGENRMGQANVWYADKPDAHRQFRSDVLSYLETRRLPRQRPTPTGRSQRQSDPLLRQKVEQAAIDETTAYYKGLGYDVGSVESDNVGWDLNAVHASLHVALKLEVKGLSGDESRIDLTPNEFAKLRQHRQAYRLCIVTEALTKAALAIFAYSQDSQRWEDQHGRVLEFEEIVAARCRTE
jgi:hypothetical protein